MKRNLTKEEKELTEKGIRNMQKELSSYEEELRIMIETLNYISMKRRYEELLRPYNQRKQDKEMKANLSAINSKIEEVTQTIKIDQDRISNGIEVKEKKGV